MSPSQPVCRPEQRPSLGAKAGRQRYHAASATTSANEPDVVVVASGIGTIAERVEMQGPDAGRVRAVDIGRRHVTDMHRVGRGDVEPLESEAEDLRLPAWRIRRSSNRSRRRTECRTGAARPRPRRRRSTRRRWRRRSRPGRATARRRPPARRSRRRQPATRKNSRQAGQRIVDPRVRHVGEPHEHPVVARSSRSTGGSPSQRRRRSARAARRRVERPTRCPKNAPRRPKGWATTARHRRPAKPLAAAQPTRHRRVAQQQRALRRPST